MRRNGVRARTGYYILLIFLVLALVLFSALYQFDDAIVGQFRTAPSQSVQQAVSQETLTETNEKIIYVYGAGLIARKDSAGLVYQHQDYLSSNRFATDGSGKLVSREVQEPYGVSFEDVGTAAALSNDYSFTGKEEDDRLYYFGSRYYDPRTARFLSVDPLATAGSPYSYAKNNPALFIDPDGKDTVAAPRMLEENSAYFRFFERHPTVRSVAKWVVPTTYEEYLGQMESSATTLAVPLETGPAGGVFTKLLEKARISQRVSGAVRAVSRTLGRFFSPEQRTVIRTGFGKFQVGTQRYWTPNQGEVTEPVYVEFTYSIFRTRSRETGEMVLVREVRVSGMESGKQLAKHEARAAEEAITDVLPLDKGPADPRFSGLQILQMDK